MKGRREVGRRGEERAAEWLAGRGFAILGRNYYTRLGELDLVAREGDTLVFVEVKTRRTLRCGRPAESVTPKKIEAMKAAALLYMQQEGWPEKGFRFDVVEVYPAGSDPEFLHIRNITA